MQSRARAERDRCFVLAGPFLRDDTRASASSPAASPPARPCSVARTPSGSSFFETPRNRRRRSSIPARSVSEGRSYVAFEIYPRWSLAHPSGYGKSRKITVSQLERAKIVVQSLHQPFAGSSPTQAAGSIFCKKSEARNFLRRSDSNLRKNRIEQYAWQTRTPNGVDLANWGTCARSALHSSLCPTNFRPTELAFVAFPGRHTNTPSFSFLRWKNQ